MGNKALEEEKIEKEGVENKREDSKEIENKEQADKETEKKEAEGEDKSEAKKSVLVVSESGGGFTVNALDEAIKKRGIETVNAAVSSMDMTERIKASTYVIIVDCYNNTLALGNIKHICREFGKKLMLCGDETAIGEMRRVFEERDLAHVFKRPIEAGDVAKKISEIITKADNVNVRNKVLVVDDNGVMLRTIMGWLEGKYEVALANSATSAFSAIQRSKPDLILLDYEMPVCSGAQFLEMMRMEDDMKDIPVIFLTSRNDAETVKEVMALRPKGYILKSTPQERVINSVDNYFKNLE